MLQLTSLSPFPALSVFSVYGKVSSLICNRIVKSFHNVFCFALLQVGFLYKLDYNNGMGY